MSFASHVRSFSACAALGAAFGARPSAATCLAKACELTTARLNHVPMPSSMCAGSTTSHTPACASSTCRFAGVPTTGYTS